MFGNLNIRYLALNLLIFAGAGVTPMYLIAYSNKHVFPTTLTMANGFLLMSLLAEIACMVVVAHKGADARTIVGGLLGQIFLGIVLWWNIGGHWQLSREYDAAQSTVQENIEEEKRAAEREKKRVENEKVFSDLRQRELDALAKLEKQQAINTDATARLARATGFAPMTRPRPRITPLPTATPTPVSPVRTNRPASTPRPTPLSPAEVRESWMGTLTTRAYVEAGVAILTLIGLGILWHADFDGDGRPDRFQRLSRQTLKDLYPEEYEKLYGGDVEALPPANLGETKAVASLPSSTSKAGFIPPRVLQATPRNPPDPVENPRGAQKLSPESLPALEPIDYAAPRRKEGKDWILFGLRFPDIPGVRYESKRKTGVIEYWGRDSHRGSMIGQFGKREVVRLASLSDGERAIDVAAAIANKIAKKGGL